MRSVFAAFITCFTLLNVGWTRSPQPESALRMDGLVAPAVSGGLAGGIKKPELTGVDLVDLVRRSAQADK